MEREVATIDRTFVVAKPSGEITEVNRFDYNITICAKPNAFIQCTGARVLFLTIQFQCGQTA